MRPESALSISPEARASLDLYYKLLLKWQKSINLVSGKTLDQAWDRHFADSCQLVSFLRPHHQNIVDLGSGGGFPALVMAICCPSITFNLIESDGRKCEFLRTVSRETGLKNVYIHSQRVEAALPNLSANLITARAFAPLHKILEFAMLHPDYERIEFLLLKGKNCEEELAAARADFQFDLNAASSLTDPEASVLFLSHLRKT